MPKRRVHCINEAVVGVYRIESRTTRGAFIKGIDRVTLRTFDYREKMVLRRIEVLTTVFAIECLDQLVVPTALHMILRNRPDLPPTWTDEEVVTRWLKLNRGKLALNEKLDERKFDKLIAKRKEVAQLRVNLGSISSFMAYLRQPIGVVANQEDYVQGFFWEPRFRCYRLADDPELWTCAQYLPEGRFRLVVHDD